MSTADMPDLSSDKLYQFFFILLWPQVLICLIYRLSLQLWPRTRCPRDQTLKTTKANPPSPFRRLHPDLLHIVLGFVRATGQCIYPELQISRETKRHLSACSLTCRSWAEGCRPFVFERITVRSDEDLRQLSTFLCSPVSTIARYIMYLEVRESSTWTCLHTVPIILYRRLPQLRSLDLTCGPTASVPFVVHQLWPTRPNFPYLPHFDRTMLAYRRGLQGVTTLALRGYRFRDLGMLLRLVGGFSVLETLHCDDVSWYEESFSPAHFRMIRSLPSATLRIVTARSPPGLSFDYSDLLWLLACAGGPTLNDKRGLLNSEEVPTLIKLARFVYWGRGDHRRVLSFACSSMQYAHFHVDAHRRTFYLWILFGQGCTDIISLCADQLTITKRILSPAGMPCQLTSGLTIRSCGAEYAYDYSRVHSLCITRCELLMSSLQQADVEEFGSYLEQLPQLQHVKYSFSQGDISCEPDGDRNQHHRQLARREILIGPDNVDLVSATVTDSIHHDAAAYLGMVAYVLSRPDAGALFTEKNATSSSPDVLAAFFAEGRLAPMLREAASSDSNLQRHVLQKVSYKKLR